MPDVQVNGIDWVIHRYRTFQFSFIYEDADLNPIDLTGWTISSVIRQAPTAPDPPLATLTVSVPTPANGQVFLSIDDTTTSGFGWSQGAYDVEAVHPDTTTETILSGNVYVTDSVTR
jgi:hypothetical protein